eukprot:m.1399181 g.1399181  ORF g.1399181 m.1399181 type:complete len:67 (+) comp25001_c1_seq2:482-682(+)
MLVDAKNHTQARDTTCFRTLKTYSRNEIEWEGFSQGLVKLLHFSYGTDDALELIGIHTDIEEHACP